MSLVLTECNLLGELYATKFFSAKKMKFILFFSSSFPVAERSTVLSHWKLLSETFRSKALFAYIVGNAIPDVLEYFSIDERKDLPLIIAHDPSRDYKYVSKPRLELTQTDQQDFIAGVLSGKVPRVMKSEAIPRPRKKTSTSTHVVKLVGKTVIEAVSQPCVAGDSYTILRTMQTTHAYDRYISESSGSRESYFNC